ncbi:hypothetical protein MKEN_00066000 [Mycena kentingensis (nom. inval.)]|nr:hypothetical protein MKEN_00066000 [Mycena kentingensis (nom. inval.)]
MQEPTFTTTLRRPQLARQESDLYASYYESPLADAGFQYSPRRSVSADSTSSSDYSTDDGSTDHPPPLRRASVPSEGGGDRRRLAIVQMDHVTEQDSSASKPVAVRRGLNTRLDGIALVGPPDTDRKYLYEPPPSAPPQPVRSMVDIQRDDTPHHARSASEASKASRDVGIVGTSKLESPKKLRIEIAADLEPPVFQEPHASRAPTPNSMPQPKRRSTDLSVHTPEIGQSKDVHVPVAAPVVVNLGSDPSLRPNSSTDYSAFLNYQPGVHATAGPLPPPPRATFAINPSTPPPPRPPRLHSPPPRRKDGLLPGVSSVLNSSGSNTPSSSNSRSVSPARPQSSSGDSSNDEILHRREGAFSPSIITTTPSTSLSDYSPPITHLTRSINGMITEEPKHGLPAEDWTHVSNDTKTERPSLPLSNPASADAPSPPPKGLKDTITTGLRRISSLPRTPSRSSSRRSSTRSSSARSHKQSPSPVPPVPAAIPAQRRREKIVEQYPAALFSADIFSQKSPTERCALYAHKINQLYIHDSGLEGWVAEMQFRSAKGSKRGILLDTSHPKPRQVSHSSIKSEATQATFPRRADATVATDLSTKPSDIAPMPAAPSLPYPALSPRSNTSPLPPSSMRLLSPASKTGNFFSSLGRKASMSKKERPNIGFSLGTSATTTRLVKSPPGAQRELRPVIMASGPSVPGGPRAPPSRIAATILVHSDNILVVFRIAVYGQRYTFISAGIEDADTLQKLEEWKASVLGALKELQTRVQQALTLQERAAIIFDVAPYSGDGKWVTADSRACASEILNQFAHPPKELFVQILQYNLKPIFFAHAHPSINVDTGRKLGRPAGGALAAQDFYDSQTWKDEPGVDEVIVWCVKNMPSRMYEELWHLLIPPLMAFLDDYEAAYKLAGVRITAALLERVPGTLLRRTGVDSLLSEALHRCITVLDSPETPVLLPAAVSTTTSLIMLTTVEGSVQRFDQLSALLGNGIIGSVWPYSSNRLPALLASVEALPAVVEMLGVGCARYLKVLIAQLVYPLAPLAYQASTILLQIASLRALVAVIQACPERVSSSRGTILNAVGRCWVEAVEHPGGKDELKRELQTVCRRLEGAYPAIRGREYAQVMALNENLFAGLLVSTSP